MTYAETYSTIGTPLPVRRNGKAPVPRDWQRMTPAEGMAACAGWQGNIGLALPAGLFALDVDGATGAASLEALQARHGELPATLTQITPHGRHLLFTKPEGLRLKNSVGVLGDGLDIRTQGGQIVVEPSNVNGAAYQWQDWQPDTGEVPEIAPAPDWLLALLTVPQETQQEAPQAPPARSLDAYALRALERATSAVVAAGEGTRNDTLNGAAYGIARLAAAGRLDWHHAAAMLERAAQSAGLAPAEIAATLESARSSGWQSPNTEGLPTTRAEPARDAPMLVPVDVAGVLSAPSPPPAFVWDGYLPRGVVALLGAHGGAGKSTIALMLAVAVVTGRALLGVPVTQGRVLLATLEDAGEIVRHRLAWICRHWRIDPRTLAEGLHIVDGTGCPELFIAEHRTAGTTTPTYEELRRQAAGVDLVIVDNASDGYGGNEIDRQQVRTFMRALGRIAKDNNAACLLLAHVSKDTSRNGKAAGGEAYSGSTAWHNSARSRLFLSRGEDGALELEHQKAQFGKMHKPLRLRWPDDELPDIAGAEPGGAEVMDALLDKGRAADLLRLLAEFEARGHYCGTALTARNNPHAMLRSEPDFKRLRLGKDDVRRLVNLCQREGWLEAVEHRTANRKTCEVWTVTDAGRTHAGLEVAPSAPSAPSLSESAENPAQRGAPSAPSCVGGMGELARAQEGAGGAAP